MFVFESQGTALPPISTYKIEQSVICSLENRDP